MPAKDKVFLLILLAVVFQAALILSNPYPVLPDVFERMRVADYFQQNLAFPDWDNAIAPDGAPYVYPPLADLFLAGFSSLTQLPLASAWPVLVIIFYLLFLLGMQKFSGLYLDQKQQFILFIFLMLSPLVARKFAIYIAEAIALALLPWLFYAIKEEKKPLVTAVIVIIALTHLRSFLTLLALLAAYALTLFYWQRKKLKAFLPPVLAGLLLPLPWYALHYAKLAQLQGYYSPYGADSVLSVLEFLGLPLVLFTLLFFFYRKQFKLDLLLPVLFFMPIVSMPFVSVFPLRQVVFLLIPMAIFSAFSFSKLIERLTKHGKITVLVLVVLVSSLLFIFPQTIYTADDEAIITALHDNAEKGSTFFADPWLSYWAAKDGHRVVVGPFMERVPDASQRMVDMESFLFQAKAEVLERYQVDCYVFRDGSGLLPGFKEVVSTPSKNLYCRG